MWKHCQVLPVCVFLLWHTVTVHFKPTEGGLKQRHKWRGRKTNTCKITLSFTGPVMDDYTCHRAVMTHTASVKPKPGDALLNNEHWAQLVLIQSWVVCQSRRQLTSMGLCCFSFIALLSHVSILTWGLHVPKRCPRCTLVHPANRFSITWRPLSFFTFW